MHALLVTAGVGGGILVTSICIRSKSETTEDERKADVRRWVHGHNSIKSDHMLSKEAASSSRSALALLYFASAS